MTTALSSSARAAVAYIEAQVNGPELDPAMRVNLHFHPDRLLAGRTVLEHLGADRTYRSQYETGTSNGGLTAHPGGDRWLWEHRIFGGAYDAAPAAERPKYGALNHRRRSVGAAPRFGSAHLRLHPHVRDRTTFSFPDSVFEPTSFATADRFDLFPLVDAFDAVPRTDLLEATEGGLLDDYIEAHVHGVLDLGRDVEALVLDPCYRDTVIEDQARGLDIPVEWHDGFCVTTDVVRRHPDFRGPRTVEVAEAVAVGGRLDARIIGEAVRRGEHDLQDLKKVWHCTARYGWHWDRSERSRR